MKSTDPVLMDMLAEVLAHQRVQRNYLCQLFADGDHEVAKRQEHVYDEQLQTFKRDILKGLTKSGG